LGFFSSLLDKPKKSLITSFLEPHTEPDTADSYICITQKKDFVTGFFNRIYIIRQSWRKKLTRFFHFIMSAQVKNRTFFFFQLLFLDLERFQKIVADDLEAPRDGALGFQAKCLYEIHTGRA